MKSQQIPDDSRFLVGQYVTVHDDVISHVNITNVKEEDGGEYTCTAQNIIGKYVPERRRSRCVCFASKKKRNAKSKAKQ